MEPGSPLRSVTLESKYQSYFYVNPQVMTNPELRSMWLGEVKDMADRIISMRAQLRDGLAANGKS